MSDDHDHDYRDVGPNEPVQQQAPEGNAPSAPGTAPAAPPSVPAPPDTHTNTGGTGGGNDRLDVLERTVSGLVDIVAGLTPKDDRPVKVPWTHRGSGRRDDQ